MISRGTKAFSARSGTGYPGSFPVNFLKWVQNMGWWGDRRIYLCCGAVKDDDADRVDIQSEIAVEVNGRRGHNATVQRSRTLMTTANIIGDARDTGIEANTYDWCMLDPPYTRALAETMYGTDEVFSGADRFLKEAVRLCKPGGYICCLHYDIPKTPKECVIVACWGVYQIPAVRYMSAFMVYQKKGERELQGLERWME